MEENIRRVVEWLESQSCVILGARTMEEEHGEPEELEGEPVDVAAIWPGRGVVYLKFVDCSNYSLPETKEAFRRISKGARDRSALFWVVVPSECYEKAKELLEGEWSEVAPSALLEIG